MHVHQPWRVRDYTIFNAAHEHDYFDGHEDNDRNNQKVFLKVADKSYRPMNTLLLRLASAIRFSIFTEPHGYIPRSGTAVGA